MVPATKDAVIVRSNPVTEPCSWSLGCEGSTRFLRFRLVAGMIEDGFKLAAASIRAAHPEYTPEEVRTALRKRISMIEQVLRAILPVLEGLGIPYLLTGGIAVTLHGRPRFTQDIDIVIAPTETRLFQLIRLAGDADRLRGERT